jgi:POT family proton-dependent oligopeptide transporter
MSKTPSHDELTQQLPTLFGHPTGLFQLFFAEMWERFSFYGMRALLTLYMIKGFLAYQDNRAYAVYGAYTALVYMTPFFGGLLADHVLGQRIAVIIGGILMALGHLIMGYENPNMFYFALALIILGNGFFKPNISTMVGQLYPAKSRMRDGGFTIFYIGVNLGASISPLLCGYIGEQYGWHYGFGLATIGMMLGLVVFVVPTRIGQVLIGIAAAACIAGLLIFRASQFTTLVLNSFAAFAMFAAAVVSIRALSAGGLPNWAGQPPGGKTPWAGLAVVLIGTVLAMPVVTLMVSGFSVVTKDSQPIQLIGEETAKSISSGLGPLKGVAEVFLGEISKPAGLLLTLTGFAAAAYLIFHTVFLERVARHRMIVALTLIFFSILFWAFFEQAGSSLNNFADRNVDRVGELRRITESEVGSVIRIQPTQEQLGFTNGEKLFTMDQLNSLRQSSENKANPNFEIDWTVHADNVGMGVANRSEDVAASVFQSINAICILIFGLLMTTLWSVLGKRGLEPPTPVKFGLGIIQVGLGFGAIWYGTQQCDSRGMVNVTWLILGYVLHTTGELCVSPVGLSMVTKLSPKFLVSTVMGAWFLATAFAQYLAAIISQFTGVSHEGGNGAGGVPLPIETVHVYGEVFRQIAIAAIIGGVVCLVLSPLLTAWMHTDAPVEGEGKGGH